MVFEMSWINIGSVIHILQKNLISQIKGPKATHQGDYKFLTCCSIVIFSFSNHFISLLLPLEV